MKTLLLLLSAFLLQFSTGFAADARVITENGTNILAVGIDQRDFEVVRFYLKGTNTIEFRAEDIVHKGRAVFTKDSTNDVERAALRAAIKASVNNGNVPPGKTSEVLAALIRLQELDDLDDADRKKPKK